MKTYKINLPKELHSNQGKQKDIHFEMSRRHYEINGEQFDNPLTKELNHPGFEGYMHQVQNTFVLVTLFYTEDVLETI